jgi:hypothetical protein
MAGHPACGEAGNVVPLRGLAAQEQVYSMERKCVARLAVSLDDRPTPALFSL